MKRKFKHEQSEPTWQSFEQQQQFFTYEQKNEQPSTLDPSLLGRSSYDPASTFKQPSWVVQQFQPLPDWGVKAAVNDINTAGPEIAKDIINQPLAAATRATELEDQKDSLKRLQNLQKPVMDSSGKPVIDQTGTPVTRADYLQTVGPNGQSTFTPNPTTLATQGNVFGNGPYIQQGTTPQVQTGNQPSAQQTVTPPQAAPPVIGPPTAQAPATPPTVGASPLPATPPAPAPLTPTQQMVTDSVFGKQTNATPTTGSNPIASSAPATPPIPSSPMPVDTAQNLAGKNPAPSQVLDWYQQTIDSRGKDARAEIGPDGTPTGRTVVIHDPKANMGDQVVHPAYMAANLGTWTPPDTTPSQIKPNPAIGAPPTVPPAAEPPPVAAQAANNDTPESQGPSPLLAQAMTGSQSDLPGKLARGEIQPSDLTGPTGAGGEPWAASAGGPQAPLQKGVPGVNALLNPVRLPGASLPNVPPTTTAPKAQLVPNQQLPPPTGPEAISPKNFGLSSEEVLRQAQEALVNGKDGKDTEQPLWNDGKGGTMPGPASMTVPIIGADGKPATGYVDPSGGVDANGKPMVNAHTVYQKQSTGYGESRSFLDGSHTDVPNVIGQAQKTAMMNTIVEQGLAPAQDLDKMSPDSFESLYRIAANKKLDPQSSNAETNDQLQKRMAILDAGTKLQDTLQALNTQNDPGGIQAKNLLAATINAAKNKLGPIVGTHADPALSNAQAAYANFNNIVRAQETNRPATDASKIGAGTKDSGFDPGSIGDLTDDRYGPNLQTYLQNQGRLLSRGVDFALSSKFRVPDDVVHAANLVHYSDQAIGSTSNPFKGVDKNAYSKIPMGSSYQWAGTDSNGQPWPVYTKGKQAAD